MASADDILNAINASVGRLDDIKGKLDGLKASTDAVKSSVDSAANQLVATLNAGFAQLIALGDYTNQALYHNDVQNDTMICELTHISKNTCGLLNEAAAQTRIQSAIEQAATRLAFLYATVHAEAELERERMAKLREEIEKCCPPPAPQPPCAYEPCAAPEPIGPPRYAGRDHPPR